MIGEYPRESTYSKEDKITTRACKSPCKQMCKALYRKGTSLPTDIGI